MPARNNDRALQIAMMFRLSRRTRILPYAFVVCLLLMFWDRQPWYVHAWLVAHYSFGTWLFDRLRAAYIAAGRPAEWAAAEPWGRKFALASLVTGSTWGFAGWVYFTPGAGPQQTFLALTILALATSAVVSRAGYLPAFYAYFTTAVGPFILRSFLTGETVDAYTGLLGLVYATGITLWAHSFADEQRRNVALRSENTDLVERLQQALHEAEAARAEAERAGRLRTDFLANMSHELRTPLNGILGMTGLLLASRLEERQRAYAEAVRRSGESLLGIINDVLDFARLDADRVTLERIDFDLRDTVLSACELVAPKAHDKGLEIDTFYDPALPDVVLGDPARTRQVLLNLVGNAIKFTERGSVTVSARVAGQRDGQVVVRFAVADTGIGVSPEAEPHLFTRFAQADASIARRFGGSGLGLAIARRLVKAMGGEIGFERPDGGGATFWFSLPFAPLAPAAQRPPRLQGLTVAIVADRPNPLLVAKLRIEGAAALEGEHDPETLRLLKPDVVIFDAGDDPLAMAARALPFQRLQPRPRLVLLVRLGLSAALPEALEPFDARLFKPFRRDGLVAALAPEAGLPIAAQPASQAGPHVLVVDDLKVNRDLLAELLRGAGCRVETAADGDEAVERVAPGGFDLVFMDLEMPRLHGLAAARAIRTSAGAGAGTPLVAVSAHLGADQVARCRAAGFDDFITKPIDPARLGGLLSALGVRAPSAAGLADIDAAALAALRVQLGRDKVDELLREVAYDLDRRLPRLLGAARNGDEATLRREGHIVKGLAGNFGLPLLAHAADRMLQSARGEQAPALAAAQATLDAWSAARGHLRRQFPAAIPEPSADA